MPFYNGIKVTEPDGSVGVDDNCRYIVHDGETFCVEHYPWPFRFPYGPYYAIIQAFHVGMWHIRVIRQYGWHEYRYLAKL
jgi:hypothetical protein